MNSYGLLNINGISIYHESYGQGTPLFLLHGNGEDSKIFEEQVAFFSRHFRVITLDARGHGRSTLDVEKLSYEAMASDLHRVLNAMSITRCHIIGFSDGGIVALELALRAPERIISMVVVGANYRPNGLKPLDRLATLLMYGLYALLSLFAKKYRRNQRLMKLMLHQPQIAETELKNMLVPTLVVAGSNDMVRHAHTLRLASLLPNSTLEIIPNSSHFVLREHPHTFNDTALDFLYNNA